MNTHNFDRKLGQYEPDTGQNLFWGHPPFRPWEASSAFFTANDPLFSNPLATVTLFPGINSTGILTNRLTNFEIVHPTGGPMPYPVNFAQMAHVATIAALRANAYPPVTAFLCGAAAAPPPTSFQRTTTGKGRVDYYTSVKQYTFGISQNLYALYGDDPLTFFAVALGKYAMHRRQQLCSRKRVVLEWAASPSGLLLENPCNPLTFPFYHQKQRRFFQNAAGAVSEEFGISDPPTLEELQEYTQQAYYQQTGNCLIVGDLETLLSKLSAENKLAHHRSARFG